MQKFKIIKRKKDCVLLMQIKIGNIVKYMVKDIEGDIVYMNYDDLASAERFFEKYDLEAIRAEKKKLFEHWLEEFAEA